MPMNLSFTHIVVVGIVALVVLGPDRLPAAARAAGKLYRQWKDVSAGLQAEVRDVFGEFAEPFTDAVNEIRGGPPEESGVEPTPVEPANPSAPLAPLAPAIPALGPSSDHVVAGPVIDLTIPSLGPTPEPGTVVPHPGAPPSR